MPASASTTRSHAAGVHRPASEDGGRDGDDSEDSDSDDTEAEADAESDGDDSDDEDDDSDDDAGAPRGASMHIRLDYPATHRGPASATGDVTSGGRYRDAVHRPRLSTERQARSMMLVRARTGRCVRAPATTPYT
jgi:hypothetical protein